MLTAELDYDLPARLIAQYPPRERDAARMLVLERGAEGCRHRHFTDLPGYLRAGDLVVLNDTRVFPARLVGQWRDTGGTVELLLLEPAQGGGDGREDLWEALCGSGRRARAGQVASFGDGALTAEIVRPADSGGLVRVALRGAAPLAELLARHGRTPLPPYIARRAAAPGVAALDRERYQTVYARQVGAVAAPTAGMHFTNDMLNDLARAGIAIATVTLHVGPGTFQPVKTERIEDHRMHEERYEVTAAAAAAINSCRARGGRILAVGSTTVRTLETMAADHDGQAVACAGRSRLFIRPPYRFCFSDRMLTNFHLPRSTLLAMVAALAGREQVMAAYREAIASEYLFYSYGDCMLIL